MFSKFIKASNDYTVLGKHVPAPYLRRGFELDFVPSEAKIAICTPGFYELYVNGKNITKGAIAPYISNPNHMLCYDEYDVSAILKKGKNAIGVILGNGFQNQTTPKWFFSESSFSAPVSVSLDLSARSGEKSFSLSSDESFKVHSSPIIYDIYRDGTHYDARLEINGWCEGEFDDSAWQSAMIAPTPCGEIIPCTAHPIVSRAEIAPISIEWQEDFCYYKTCLVNGEDVECTRTAGGYLYDFGINTSGVCRLKIKGERGQKITLRHGEKLYSDGKFNINSTYFNPSVNPEYADHVHLFQTDVYILKGGEEEIFVPAFTYHGFRYVFVEGLTREQATKDLLTYIVLSSDVKKRASFNCSDKNINALYAMTINADLSNFHYFMTDCPHREKNGWTGDASVSAEQVFMTFDAAESFKLWLRAMRHTQREDGMLPGVVPTEKYGYSWGNGPMWDSAAINIPYAAYKYDGRLDLFKDVSDMMDKYLHYIASRRDDKGLIACGLGDWCQPKRGLLISIKAPLALTDSVTTYDTATKAAILYRLIGEEERAEYAESLAKELRADIRRELIDYETMTAKGDCQTSQAYMLAKGMFEPDEYALAYAKLIEIIDRDGKKLDTGMIGLRYIFEVLIQGGDMELALSLILNDEEPSYKMMINKGCTALCESIEDGTNNASENHHFFGDIIRVFTNYIAGLRPNPNLDNMNEILISPIFPSGIDFADAEYKGVKAGWKKQGDKILVYADIPEGFFGKFEYGEISVNLKCGRNEFTV